MESELGIVALKKSIKTPLNNYVFPAAEKDFIFLWRAFQLTREIARLVKLYHAKNAKMDLSIPR